MLKLPLQRARRRGSFDPRYGVVSWTSALPFFDNPRAVLIHRPRSVSTYSCAWRGAWLAVHCWCGNGMTSNTERFAFLPDVPDGRIVCARCEDKAVEAGLPTSDQLAGRHIHKGGVVAVRECCPPVVIPEAA